MPVQYFTLLHVIAAFGAIAALTAICLGPKEEHRKPAIILHGISLLILLLVGLHMIFSMDLVKSGGWWHTKILLWLVLGAAPALARRKVLPPGALLGIILLVAALASYLGLIKPF